ncbi:NUMOD1 domain-containing DNA-binding protein [Paenibacillus oleatilyticus]|uniref:NUMOD1 domain-containing DNA-binding protein n=1 Tax=Paenibacillus oleatilyticus TaxID=2594886 RepID=UPI001C201403|nr:NUMOD1 domain-containing DNA-binding protein [Paenibacillus oleatilyticus]MBU7315948.1 HNH endonuclease [Paenibacillus oleatilyticus]
MEEWKRIYIKNKKTNYEISNFGRCRNVFRLDWKNKGILKPKYNKKNGYNQYCLKINNTAYYRYAHRLVAEYFVEGSLLLHVNHKDGNKRNNNATNLEWVTQSQNMKHAFDHGLVPTSKEVEQYDLKGNYIATYISISEAARKTGINVSSISASVLRRNMFSGRFQWRYKNDSHDIKDISKKIVQYNNGVVKLTLDGQYITEYETITEAYKELNKIDNGMISQVCKGNRNRYSGFKWMYKTNYYGVDEDIVYSHSN